MKKKLEVFIIIIQGLGNKWYINYNLNINN